MRTYYSIIHILFYSMDFGFMMIHVDWIFRREVHMKFVHGLRTPKSRSFRPCAQETWRFFGRMMGKWYGFQQEIYG